MTYAPADLNTIEHFVDGGLLYTGFVPARDSDVLGLFGLYGHFSPDLRRSQVAHGEPGMEYEAVLGHPGRSSAERHWSRPGCLVLAMQVGVIF